MLCVCVCVCVRGCSVQFHHQFMFSFLLVVVNTSTIRVVRESRSRLSVTSCRDSARTRESTHQCVPRDTGMKDWGTEEIEMREDEDEVYGRWLEERCGVAMGTAMSLSLCVCFGVGIFSAVSGETRTCLRGDEFGAHGLFFAALNRRGIERLSSPSAGERSWRLEFVSRQNIKYRLSTVWALNVQPASGYWSWFCKCECLGQMH